MKESNVFSSPITNDEEIVINDFLSALVNSDLNKFVVKGCIALRKNLNGLLDSKVLRLTKDLDLHYPFFSL